MARNVRSVERCTRTLPEVGKERRRRPERDVASPVFTCIVFCTCVGNVIGDVSDGGSDGGRPGQHGYPKKRRGMHRLGPRMPQLEPARTKAPSLGPVNSVELPAPILYEDKNKDGTEATGSRPVRFANCPGQGISVEHHEEVSCTGRIALEDVYGPRTRAMLKA